MGQEETNPTLGVFGLDKGISLWKDCRKEGFEVEHGTDGSSQDPRTDP